MVTGKGSPCLYPNPRGFSSSFLPLPCWGRGVSELLGGHLTAVQGEPVARNHVMAIYFCMHKPYIWSLKSDIQASGARLYLFFPGLLKKKTFSLHKDMWKRTSNFHKPSFLWRASCYLPTPYNHWPPQRMDVWEYQSCHIISWELTGGCGSRMHLIVLRLLIICVAKWISIEMSSAWTKQL